MGYFSLTFVALTFCVSGSLLTVLNKQIMTYLPTPNVVLFAQNTVTVLLLWCGKFFHGMQLEPIQARKARRWFSLVVLFYTMLASSLLALEAVIATTLIVQRNLCTVSIAFLDYLYFGTVQTRQRIFAIIGMCLGSVVYVYSSTERTSQFGPAGYAWLIVNILATTAYQIRVKSLVNELAMNSWTMTYYNNLLSIPMCVGIAVWQRELQRFQEFTRTGITAPRIACLLISCTLGFCLSVSAFQLNRLISPTSITILNNTNKFILLFFTACFMDYSALSAPSVLAAAIVMICAAYYSVSGRKC